MDIQEDIERILKILLYRTPPVGDAVTTIYSVNFASRPMDDVYYSFPESILKMVEDGVLELLETAENGQPTPNNNIIYYKSYTVRFNRKDIGGYLNESYDAREKGFINRSQDEIYRWKELTLDLSTYTLTFKDNAPYSISLTREIRFLRLLMINQPNVVTYQEFADEFGSDPTDEKVSSSLRYKGVAEQIQDVRQDLIDNFLMPAGMPKERTDEYIRNVRSVGYKLG